MPVRNSQAATDLVGGLTANPIETMFISARFNGACSNSGVTVPKASSITAQFNGAGSFSANALTYLFVTPRFNGAGSLSANATVPSAAPDALSAVDQTTGDPTAGAALIVEAAVTIAATFNGAGILRASVSQRNIAAATFSGAGSLSVLVRQNQRIAATFAGAGSLSADATKVSGGVQQSIAATFNGTGSLSALANLRMVAS